MSQTRRRSNIQLGNTGIEIVTLRASAENEADYAPCLEDETWCRLHSSLPVRLGLRFLIRKIEPGKTNRTTRITIGGVQVQDVLVVDNLNDKVICDRGVDKDAKDEVSWHKDRGPNNQLVLVLRQKSMLRNKFRAQFRLRVNDGFEFHFDYGGKSWAGIVNLISVKKESSFGNDPAYTVGQFEIIFSELEPDDELDESSL